MNVRTETGKIEHSNCKKMHISHWRARYTDTATSSYGLLIWYSQTDSTAEEIRTRLDRIPFQASAQVILASTDLHSFSHINTQNGLE